MDEAGNSTARVVVCAVADGPSLMRRAIAPAHMAAFMAEANIPDPEALCEAYLASLRPRPRFGLDDDARLRAEALAAEFPELKGAELINTGADQDLHEVAAFCEASAASRLLLYSRMRLASDRGIAFVRDVAAAEAAFSQTSAFDGIAPNLIAHSPHLRAAWVARRIGAPAPAAADLGVLRFCFHRDTLIDPIQPADADAPKRIGALALGIVR